MDEVVVPEAPQERRPAPAPSAGLQSLQFHTRRGTADGDGAVVADYAAGKIGLGEKALWTKLTPTL